MLERLSPHIENPQTAIRWRNFLLCCAVPAALWTIWNEVNGLLISHDLLPAFNTAIDTSVRAYLLVTKVAIPLAITGVALEASERAHLRYRQLDRQTPPHGLGERMYDFFAEFQYRPDDNG